METCRRLVAISHNNNLKSFAQFSRSVLSSPPALGLNLELCKTVKLFHKRAPWSNNQFSSVAQSCLIDSLQPHGMQHARLPCPSPTSGACSNSCPLSQWCHPIISSSVVPFSSHLQSFPASGSIPSESVLHIR